MVNSETCRINGFINRIFFLSTPTTEKKLMLVVPQNTRPSASKIVTVPARWCTRSFTGAAKWNTRRIWSYGQLSWFQQLEFNLFIISKWKHYMLQFNEELDTILPAAFSEESDKVDLLMGCLNVLTNRVLVNDPIRWIIGMIVLTFFIELPIRNEFSSIWLYNNKEFSHTCRKIPQKVDSVLA